MKRFFALVLALTMVLQLVPTSVLAADNSGWKSFKGTILRSTGDYWTVTWNVDGEVGSYAAADGTLLSDIVPASPKKAGYHFIGWKDADGNDIDVSTPVTAAITVIAQFEEIVYHTVTFKAEGSDDITVTLEDGATVGKNMPADPVRDGYRFDGWFAGETHVGAETVVSDDMTVVARFTELITVTFDASDDETTRITTVQIPKGEPVGSLPEVPENPGYIGKWVKQNTTDEVKADTIVESAFTAVPSYEKIVYTVTFIPEEGDPFTRTVDVDSGFALRELPEIPKKENQEGMWVYEGTASQFMPGTTLGGDVTVEAHYEQNVFTVTFKVGEAVYDTVTVYKGVALPLPSEPVKTGASFAGWFTEQEGQGTQYTNETQITEDVTLYANFEGLVRVNFIVKDKNGNVIADKSQYFTETTVGGTVGTMPEDPFIAGRAFVKWILEGSDPDVPENEVTATTVVNNNITAEAYFSDINVYEFTIQYYYMDGATRRDFNSQIINLTEAQVTEGYTTDVPQQSPVSVAGQPDIYYPEQTTVSAPAKSAFVWNETDGVYKASVEVQYVEADAEYTIGHYLKDLNGNGYSLIPSTDENPNPEEKTGVKKSVVTPAFRESYSFAEKEDRDTDVVITGTSGQELKVYYTRKDFTLSYNTNGGDYIDAVTRPYGTTITLPESANRQGYTFEGWYKDAALSESAGTSITLEQDTSVYAKWTPAQVNYKITYMIENADDDGYSFLADVTQQAETGIEVTMTAATAEAVGTKPSKLDTTNFTFKDSTTEIVKADGTTAIVVRYSRNVYTLQYNSNSNVKVTAKYGADITQEFATKFNNAYPGFGWSYDNVNNNKFSGIDKMPSLSVRTAGTGNTIIVYGHGANVSKTQILNYWLENFDSSVTTTREGKTYGRVKQITVKFNYLTDGEDFYEIVGYTKDGYSATYPSTITHNNIGSNTYYNIGANYVYNGETYRITDRRNGGWRETYDYYYTIEREGESTYTLGYYTPNAELTVHFYYATQSYPLTFYNYNGVQISTQEVKLNADISTYLTSNIPTAPVTGAAWRGWFTDAEHTNPYSGGVKMPAGLVLYGDFEFPTYQFTYDPQGGKFEDDTTENKVKTVEYEEKVENEPVTRENYNFLGWFTTADGNTRYDFETPVTADTTIYARWQQKTLGYTVHYYEKDTTNSLVPDKIVSGPEYTVGQSVTETAPSVAGYVVDKTEDTITLNFPIENNVITFYYETQPETLEYTVKYVLRSNPEIAVAAPKTVTVDGHTNTVLEAAAEVDNDYLATQTEDAEILGKHYRAEEASIEKTLALTDNEIVFYYVSYNSSKITVNHRDMDGNLIGNTKTEITYTEVGDTFTLQKDAPEGYVFHKAYLNGTTEEAQPAYFITGEEGDFTIDVYYKRKLIITAQPKVKVYDGQALISSFTNENDYEIVGKMRGDEVTGLEFDGSQTNVGTSATTPKNATITEGSTGNVRPEEYYDIIYVASTLTVQPVSVYLTISADQWLTHSGGTGGPNYYTGQEFRVGFTNPGKQHIKNGADTSNKKSAYITVNSTNYDLFAEQYGEAIWNALYGTEDGARIVATDVGEGTYTYTGAQQKELIAAIPSVSDPSKTIFEDPNYVISFYARDSQLKIEKLPLNITTPDAEKAYDGTELTEAEGALISYDYWDKNISGKDETISHGTANPGTSNLATGDEVTFAVTGTQTDPGSSTNNYTLTFTNPEKAKNYIINEQLGTLTVTNEGDLGEVVLTIKPKTATYNGEKQNGNNVTGTITGTAEASIETDEYTVTGLAKGDVLSVIYSPASGTNVGTYNNGLFGKYTITRTVGDKTIDLTKSYSVVLNKGSLTINPAPVTLTANSDISKIYNGQEQEVTGFTSSVEGLTFTGVSAKGAGIDVGDYPVNFSGVTVGETKDSTGNYVVKETIPGTLKIKPKQVTITVENAEKEYGDDDPEFTGEVQGLVNENDLGTISYYRTNAKVQNAGTYNGVLDARYTPNDNYEVSVTKGNFEIKKATVTVTADNKSKTYGDADPDLTATVSGLKNDEDESIISYTISRDPGENVGNYSIIPTGAKEQGNYTVVYENGTLTIDQAEVTVTANNKTKVYGEADPNLTATVTGLKNNDTESVLSFTVSRMPGENVGDYEISASGNVSQGNYKVKYVSGTLKITAKTVTITAKPQSYVYNGTAQGPAGTYTDEFGTYVTVVGLVGEDTLTSITLAGKKTDVGTYTGEIVPSAAEIGEATSNYTIKYVNGDLEIKPLAVTVTIVGKTDTKTYNGSEQKVEGYTVTISNSLYKESDFTFSGSAVAKGTNANGGSNTDRSYPMGLDNSQFTNNNNNFDVTFTVQSDGWLKITPATLTITADSNSKPYDGTPLTDDGWQDTAPVGLQGTDAVDSVTARTLARKTTFRAQR